MEVRLTIIGGKADQREVRLKLPFLIGRCRESDLTIAHPMVSRRHCEVFELQGMVRVRDLGSLNGTKVLGQSISEAPLRPEDELTVGPLTFRIDYDYPGENTVSVASGQVAAAAEGGVAISTLPVLPTAPQSIALTPSGQPGVSVRSTVLAEAMPQRPASVPQGPAPAADAPPAVDDSLDTARDDEAVDAIVLPIAPAEAAVAPSPPPNWFGELPPPDFSTWKSPSADPAMPIAAEPTPRPSDGPPPLTASQPGPLGRPDATNGPAPSEHGAASPKAPSAGDLDDFLDSLH